MTLTQLRSVLILRDKKDITIRKDELMETKKIIHPKKSI